MSDLAQNAPPEGEEVDAEVETVIAALDGDIRAAVRALIIANGFLMDELERARASQSNGNVRGRTVGGSKAK